MFIIIGLIQYLKTLKTLPLVVALQMKLALTCVASETGQVIMHLAISDSAQQFFGLLYTGVRRLPVKVIRAVGLSCEHRVAVPCTNKNVQVQ